MKKSVDKSSSGKIRVGIGGWSYAPWKQNFYPADLPQSRALEYASRQVTSIEVNSTFYGTQKPSTFAKWHDQTPDDFVFSIKAPRAVTYRSDLADTTPAIARFLESGLDRLKGKIGPVLWQFPPSRAFDYQVFDRFLKQLPKSLGNYPLHHVLDIRHASFECPEFVGLAHEHRATIAYTDAADVPQIADITADIVYLRLRGALSKLKYGYSPSALKRFATAAGQWRNAMVPSTMKAIGEVPVPSRCDTYVFFINGAKERAPAAAKKFLELLR